MGRTGIGAASCVIAFLLVTTGQSADNSDVVVTPTVYGAIEGGQISQGYYYRALTERAEPISQVWQQRAIGNVGFTALVKNRFTINFIGEGLMAFSSPQNAKWPQTLQPRQFFYIKSAWASYPFGNVEAPFITLQGGFFQYKYNPDARNLGEYLFRSNAYPLVIYSSFDYPMADIFGFRVNVRRDNLLLENSRLENDLILHSELLGVPVQDWSVSDILSYSLGGMATVGAGASFSRFFSVYKGVYPSTTTDPYFYPANLPEVEKQDFYFRDTVPGADSVLFDWKAIKLMARVTYHPKKLIHYEMFGREDLRFYIESDLIGTKNYPLFFNKRSDRILTTFGLNLPAFGYVDVANIEIEYCPNKSAFSDGRLYGYELLNIGNVVPLDSFTTGGYYNIKRSPWRWSVYLKKSLLDGHVSFIAQCARDHKKLNFYYFDMAYMSFIETLQTKKDWWWSLKTEFKF
jgi:hypothetical protein